MRKLITTALLLALPLTALAPAQALSSFSSSSSTISLPTQEDRNKAYRAAIEKVFTDKGFTVNHELTDVINRTYSEDYETSRAAQWELRGYNAEIVAVGNWPSIIDAVVPQLEATFEGVEANGRTVAVGIKPGTTFSHVSIYFL